MSYKFYLPVILLFVLIAMGRIYGRKILENRREVKIKKLAKAMNLAFKKSAKYEDGDCMNYVSGIYKGHNIKFYDSYIGGYPHAAHFTDIIIDNKS